MNVTKDKKLQSYLSEKSELLRNEFGEYVVGGGGNEPAAEMYVNRCLTIKILLFKAIVVGDIYPYKLIRFEYTIKKRRLPQIAC